MRIAFMTGGKKTFGSLESGEAFRTGDSPSDYSYWIKTMTPPDRNGVNCVLLADGRFGHYSDSTLVTPLPNAVFHAGE
jgi:hypothetical protein